MRCGAATLLLSLLTWISIGFYVGAGYSALSQTLVLLETYGPIKGRGNPALDDPPNMWINPDTNQWEPINPNEPGNRVPQVFAGVQYFLIAWAVYMIINSIVFIVDSVRSKKAITNRRYQGSRTSESSISCTAWLVGYCIFLAVFWFVQSCFCVLPILEFRITMQRCWDLDSPSFSTASDQNICVDLVQYGLVLFKDTNDAGYALVCGPGGNYNPPRGDLRGFCDNYYPTFVAYLIAFAGASIGTITMMMFAVHHSSNFSYLKIRRYENPNSTYAVRTQNKSPNKNKTKRTRQSSRPTSERSQPLELVSHPSYHYAYEDAPSRQNGVNLYNPNYGSSIMDRDGVPKPVPEVMSFPRYQTDDEEEIEMRTIMDDKDKEMRYYAADSDEERGRYSPASHRTDDRLIPYSHTHTPSPPPYEDEHRTDVDGGGDYRSDDYDDRRARRQKSRSRDRSSRPRSAGHRRHHRASSDDNASNEDSHNGRKHGRHSRRHLASDDDNRSGRATSDDEHLSRASGRRRRPRSSRGGSRARIHEEDESPSSDYYMNEDLERRPRKGY